MNIKICYNPVMTQHRLRNILLFLFSLIVFAGCYNINGKSKAASLRSNINLVPFVEFDSEGQKKWGYLDEDSGEVAIGAKYVWVEPFVGNFAKVKKNWGENQLIINKNEKKVYSGDFDRIILFASENGKGGAAILMNEGKKIEFEPLALIPFFYFFGVRLINTSTAYRYRLINLVNGKTVIPEKDNYLEQDIEAIGDFLIVKTIGMNYPALYQFMDNGDIKCVAEGNKNGFETAVGILRNHFKQRNINPDIVESEIYHSGIEGTITINYHFYVDEIHADPDLSGAFESLGSDFPIPFMEAQPLYRSPFRLLNTPLEITERKYVMRFNNEETSERAMGIYNETKREWELRPDFHESKIEWERGRPSFLDKDKEEIFYIVGICQTNNPNLYHILLKNENVARNDNASGWLDDAALRVYGDIYNSVEGIYMKNLYLYGEFNSMSPIIFTRRLELQPWDYERNYYPYLGIYYSDLSRIRKTEQRQP